MANPLTGDFDAVLQVSGGTINRLLASMHQNDYANPAVPSFPHIATIALGDKQVIDGVKGRLDAQIGVPQMELLDRDTDGFVLHLSIRARFRPASGSEPLADYINGQVSAEYVVADFDPSTAGLPGDPSQYLWFRVVEDSVTFDGTVGNGLGPDGAEVPVDVPATIDKVTRQLRYLMSTDFAPRPHQVSDRFRRGSMMSLAKGPGNTAVAIPIAPSGPQIGSVDRVVLGGHDFGVALSADVILGALRPALEEMRARFVETITFHAETHVDLGPLGSPTILTVDVGYTVTLTSASVEWTGNGFIVRISGQALTEKSEFNLTFDITQSVIGGFDAASEGLWLGPGGAPGVAIHYGGPFGGDVINTATPAIQSQAAGQVQGLLGQVAGRFDLSRRKGELIDQLRTLDGAADAHFEDASFSMDGVVLLGRIILSPRRPPVATFTKTPDGNGFTAWESWIPGGRIDSLRWAWRWAADAADSGTGSQQEVITFLLSRPSATQSRFGRPITPTRIPGLDGPGTVYFDAEGVQVDPMSGELADPVRGLTNRIYTLTNHVPGSTTDPTEPPDPIHHHDHWALLQLGPDSFHFQEPACNTLVVHVGDRWRPETAAVLHDGLAACRRQDAGLAVIVLFDQGRLEAAVSESADEIRALTADLEAHAIVNEDVNGEWSRALAVPERIDQPAWRLLSSTGGVTWMSDDAMTAEALGSALDDHLFPSPPPVTQPCRIDPAIVARPAFAIADPNYPPLPLSGRGPGGRALVFTMAGSTASDDRVAQLTSARSNDGAAIVVVVRGASEEEAPAYAARFGKGVIAVPDPDGSLAAAAGVRYWPTSLSIDELGTVISVDVGIDQGERDRGAEA